MSINNSSSSLAIPSDIPAAGRGWCNSGIDVCKYWETKLLARLRHAYRLSDVPIDDSIFGKGHTIRTLDVGGHHPSEDHPSDVTQQKPVVLMLHGYANGLGIWFKCIDPIVDAGFRVMCIDLPGFGLSTRPKFPAGSDGIAAEDKFLESIDAWRRQMQIKHFILCGHSFGAYLAASYAMRYTTVGLVFISFILCGHSVGACLLSIL
jgi:pimeloyl-ACP methyl ester carboxylesterase